MSNKKKEVKNSYDNIADTYSKKRSNDTSSKITPLEEKFISNLKENSLVLDAGCGSKKFSSKESLTLGFDISRSQLKKLDKNSIKIQGDISTLPFKNNVFDGLVCFHSIIHLPLEEHKKALKEFYRVLKPNSYAIVTEGEDRWCGSQKNWLNSGFQMSWDIAGRKLTKKQIQNSGFKIIEIKNSLDRLSDEKSRKPFFLIKKPKKN